MPRQGEGPSLPQEVLDNNDSRENKQTFFNNVKSMCAYKSSLLACFSFNTNCMYFNILTGLTYCVAMSVILLCVTFLTWGNYVQGVNLIVQHQSPAHFLSSRISLPYQGFVLGRELWFTGLLICVLVLGEHCPYRQLWTGVYLNLSADLVHLQMSQDWVPNRAVTLQENAESCISFFQTERKYSKFRVLKKKINHKNYTIRQF